MFTTGVNPGVLTSQIQSKLAALRGAISDIEEMYAWASGVASSDLISLGITSVDAVALLTAINDAHAVAQIYQTGLPPGSYPQPNSDYIYQASQAAVLPGI